VDTDTAADDTPKIPGIHVPLVLINPIHEGRSSQEGPIVELVFERPNIAQLREIERAQKKGLDIDAVAEIIRQIGHPWGEPKRPITMKQIDAIKSDDLNAIGAAIEYFFPKAAEAS